MRDASAFLGAWPFAGVPGFALDDLYAEYRALGIAGAALSPMAAALQPEPMAANRRLFEQLAAPPPGFTARAVPILDPSLPGWERDLDECRRRGGVLLGAVRLTPSYHDYALDAPALADFADACAALDLGLCLQARLEDERMQHPTMRVPPLAPAAIAAFAARHPRLRLLVCGAYMAELAAYRDAPNIQVELSFVESGATLRDALNHLGPDRLLLGTHTPIHMVAPNVAKLDSDDLDAGTRERIGRGNFEGFFVAPSGVSGAAPGD